MKPSERPEYYRHKYDHFETIPDINLILMAADCRKCGFEEDQEFITACEKEISWRAKSNSPLSDAKEAEDESR